MKKIFLAAVASAVLLLPLASQGLASSKPVAGTGALTDQQIAEMLANDGYNLIRVEREHDQIEAKVTRGSDLWELKLDPATGAVLQRERED